jgi:hypothetical protein
MEPIYPYPYINMVLNGEKPRPEGFIIEITPLLAQWRVGDNKDLGRNRFIISNNTEIEVDQVFNMYQANLTEQEKAEFKKLYVGIFEQKMGKNKAELSRTNLYGRSLYDLNGEEFYYVLWSDLVYDDHFKGKKGRKNYSSEDIRYVCFILLFLFNFYLFFSFHPFSLSSLSLFIRSILFCRLLLPLPGVELSISIFFSINSQSSSQ